MNPKWTWLAVAAVLAGVGAGAFSLRHRKQTPLPSLPAAASALVIPSQITLVGKIRAVHVVGVAAEVAGNIDAFLVDVGDEVSVGQELARIGSSGLESERAQAAEAVEKAQVRVEAAEKGVFAAQLEASRATADAQRVRADFDRAQKTYDRQKTLIAAGATPRLSFEKAEHEFESAQEQWNAADKVARASGDRIRDALKELDNAKKILTGRQEDLLAAESAVEAGAVLAPLDGLVVGRSGEVGQPASQSGDSLFQIATDLYDLEVVLEPKPEALKRMRPHQPALVIIPDLQGTSFTGEVKQIKDGQAIVGFTSSIPAARPGMVADVRLRPE